MASGGGVGGGPTIQPANNREQVKNIIEAVTEMQRYSISDGVSDLNPNMFAWEQVIEIFTIGFKLFLPALFASLILIPIGVAANFNLINMFGDIPTLYDKMYIFVLAFSFSLGATYLLYHAQRYCNGPVTYKIMSTLYFGAISIILIIGVLLFIGFQIIASMITPKTIIENLTLFLEIFPNAAQLAASKGYEVSVFIVSIIKPLFRISAIISLIYYFLTAGFLSYILYKKYKFKEKVVKDRDYIIRGDV